MFATTLIVPLFVLQGPTQPASGFEVAARTYHSVAVGSPVKVATLRRRLETVEDRVGSLEKEVAGVGAGLVSLERIEMETLVTVRRRFQAEERSKRWKETEARFLMQRMALVKQQELLTGDLEDARRTRRELGLQLDLALADEAHRNSGRPSGSSKPSPIHDKRLETWFATKAQALGGLRLAAVPATWAKHGLPN